VRDAAILKVQAPLLAEGILMEVEAHAGGRIGRRGDRDQQLELQVLVTLVVDHHLAGAAEERIVGDVDGDVEADELHHLETAIHPVLAEIGDVLFGAHADIFAHAEQLLAGRIARRLMAEAIGLQIEQRAVLRQVAAAGDRRVERIAGGRRQHDFGRFLPLVQSSPTSMHCSRFMWSSSLPQKLCTVPASCGKLFM
jgi:hypothetical protein